MTRTVPALLLVTLLAATSVAQPPGYTICSGTNYQNANMTGSYGLPSARRIGIRLVAPASQVIERVEWYFSIWLLAPSNLVGGGEIDIRAEDPTTGLPTNDPNMILASAQWAPAVPGPAWDGVTFAIPAGLSAGVPYWVTYTAAPQVAGGAPAYDDSGAATPYAISTNGGAWIGITSTAHGFKTRLLSTNCTGQPLGLYQVNQPGASFDIDGAMGSGGAPAMVTLAANQQGTLTFSSTNTGQLWDLGVGLLPLVPLGGGGTLTNDGQILNLDLVDPNLTLLWNGFQSPPFASFSAMVGFPSPTSYSTQMAVLDPSMLSGVALSQPTRLMIQ